MCVVEAWVCVGVGLLLWYIGEEGDGMWSSGSGFWEGSEVVDDVFVFVEVSIVCGSVV